MACSSSPTSTCAEPDGDLAWSQIWRSHHDDILSYASSLMSGDPQGAEDVVQETTLRFWRHPRVFNDDQHLGAWLRTVARNIVIDRSRRRQARPAEVPLAADLDVACFDHSDRIAAIDLIIRILSVLAVHHRAAIFEVYVLDRRLSDASIDLGVPTGTVKSRCHIALARLRDSAASLALSG